MSRPNLKVLHIDDNGEIVDPGCPHVAGCRECSSNAMAYEELQRKYKGVLSELGRLKADPEAKAEEHKLWHEAEAAHEWWRLATGHLRAGFKAEQFKYVVPRLKERNGLERVLKAIAAVAFDPSTTTGRNGETITYDSFELVNRSEEKQRELHQRVYGGKDSDQWKRWLLERIESNWKEGQ